jgi:hypothetical protein
MASQWQVFCFVTHRGENVIHEWLKKEKVQRTQIAIFQAKLDTFEQGGPDLSPGLISSGPVGKGIYKMKIKGPQRPCSAAADALLRTVQP